MTRIPRKGDRIDAVWCEGRHWVAGPWIIEAVIGAYSGPSYALLVVDDTGTKDTGKVFPYDALVPPIYLDEPR